MTEEITPLSLAGDGYQLTITTEAHAVKAQLLHSSATVQVVTDNDESYHAQRVVRDLAAMRLLVEKGRVLVKKPVLDISKEIDAAAKTFLAELVAEEARLSRMIGEHATEVARQKAQREAEERRAFEAARRAKEEAERAEAARQAAEAGKASIAALIAAKQAAAKADADAREAITTRLEASNQVAATEVAAGVRFTLAFEVEDPAALYRVAPHLLELHPRRSAILARLKELDDSGTLESAATLLPGVTVPRRPVVSTR